MKEGKCCHLNWTVIGITQVFESIPAKAATDVAIKYNERYEREYLCLEDLRFGQLHVSSELPHCNPQRC